MSSLVFPVLAALLVLPGLAGAAELTFETEGAVEFDDNAFRSSAASDEDFFWRLHPSVRLHDERGQDLRYSIRYGVPFEFATENSELDDVDHNGSARYRYHVNDRMELFGAGAARYLRSGLRRFTTRDPANQAAPLINTERERVFIGSANTGVTYGFSPRVSGSAQVDFTYFDPERRDRATNYRVQGVGGLTYVFSPKSSFGGSVVVSHQEFDDRLNIEGSQNQTYGIRGTWAYRLDETTRFSITVGPSVIETDQDDAPAAETMPLVPFAEVSGFVSGVVDQDGNDFVGTVGDGSILVGDIELCPTLADGSMTQVITGDACPLGVVLDNDVVPELVADITDPATTATLINTDPSGESDTSINVFGEVVLRKDWLPNLHTAIRYQRTQSGASGLGGSVIRDTVSLSNNWEPSERWELVARADWSNRETIVELTQVVIQAEEVDTTGLGLGADFDRIAGIASAPGGTGSNLTLRGDSSRIETMRWGVSGRATYRFTRNTSSWVQLTYNEQQSDGGTLGRASDFDNILATLGFRHVFSPIKLW